MTYKQYRFILAGLFLLLTWNSKAQQLPIYSQYFLNSFMYNPAIAGSDGAMKANLTTRQQWAGFENAPRTYAVTFQNRLSANSFVSQGASIKKKRRISNRSGKVGYGAYIFNDQNGLMNRTGIEGTYSYHIDLSNSQLSLGISGQFYQYKIKYEQMVLADQQLDDLVDGDRSTMYVPDAKIGVFYAQKDFYAGVSVEQLLQNSITMGNKGYDEYRLKRHYNVIGGYKYPLNDYFVIEPSLLMKFSEWYKPQLDARVKIQERKNYWAGLGYRTGHAIILFGGITYKSLFLGYSVDLSLNKMISYNYGTHEIVFGYKFTDPSMRYKWMNKY